MPFLRRSIVLYPASILLGLAIWELGARRLPEIVLAPPSVVLLRLFGDIPQIQGALLGSLASLALGYALAVLIGVPLGFLIGRNRTAAEMADPVLNAIYAIPPVAFVPFLVIWFGLFFEARVALVFIMSIFEILVTVAAGARDVEPALLAVGRSFGARRLALLRKVILPASLPFIFAALRIGLVRGINGMITAELFFAAANLGAVMKTHASHFDTAGLLSVILLLCILGLVAQEGLRALEARALPWHVRS